MAVYILKHATNRMKHVHMNHVMAEQARLKETTSRDEALIELKALMGDRFRPWYDRLYSKYRHTNVQVYERRIFNRLNCERKKKTSAVG